MPAVVTNSSPRWTATRARRFELVRAAWGLSCLLAPKPILHAAGSNHPDQRAVVVTRILGARHLAQGAISGLAPTQRVLLLGGIVDLIHSATAQLLGVLDPPRRRLALLDGAIAATWGVAGLRDRNREQRRTALGHLVRSQG